MTSRTVLAGLALAALGFARPARPADWDREPIRYSTAPDDNPVARLASDIHEGKVTFDHQGAPGHLKSLLSALKVPESSQVLVFSKTSLQRHKIGPATPRALYFNDDVYIGYCQKGDVLEAAAADPNLGTVFYTVSQKPGAPKVQRHAENCLLCHGASSNRGVPGHVFRSVVPERDGEPSLSSTMVKVNPTTPFKDRWGGWYVTGTHGSMTHMGNVMTAGGGRDDIDPKAGQNVTDLSKHFGFKPYLTPHSDIVALMVMEHQGDMHNRLARATLEGRVAIHRNDEDSIREVRALAEEIVDGLLCRDEAPLTAEVRGTTAFATEFAKRGPFDSRGRSLRQLDLKTRLFKYPASYMVYSTAFQKLPAPIKTATQKRMYAVLTGEAGLKEFPHLAAADRQAIREILADTLPDKPGYWK